MQSLEPVSNLDEARAEFDRCWPWLWESLCVSGPTHTKEQVWFRIYHGKAYLWPAQTCAIVGEFIDWPIGFRDFNYWLQSSSCGNLHELLSLHPGIEAWAMAKGCHRATGYGREGWARVMHGDWQKGLPPQKGLTPRTKWLVEPPLAVRRAQARNR